MAVGGQPVAQLLESPFKQHYIASIEKAFQPYKPLIQALSDDVTVLYDADPQAQIERISVGVSGKAVRTAAHREWGEPLAQNTDKTGLEHAGQRFQAWLPGAMLRALHHARTIERDRLTVFSQEQLKGLRSADEAMGTFIYDLTSSRPGQRFSYVG